MKVLVFVNRKAVKKRLERALLATQFVVEATDSIEECIRLSHLSQYDGVLADSDSVVFEDVVSLVIAIRGASVDIALFVLSRYYDVEQRMRLFQVGTDVCVHEPFFVSEIAVRMRLLIRLRKAASKRLTSSHLLRVGDLELNLIQRTSSRSGRTSDLRPKEFLLLEYLMRNANRPLTRSMLVEQIWNSTSQGLMKVVDVYISALRSKIDRGFSEKLIVTTRGIGYTLSYREATAEPHRGFLQERVD